MSEKEVLALDLLLEDLRTVNPRIRTKSKNLGCEEELNSLQNQIIQFLSNRRDNIG